MKKIIFLIIIVNSIVKISGTLKAQCNPPPMAAGTVITSSQSSAVINHAYIWVCKGATLTLTNSKGGNWVHLGTGATLNVFADSNHVYLESGASINSTGGNSVVWAKNGSTVNFVNGGNVIYNEPSAILTSAGPGSALPPCTSITFDYTNEPSGCVTGIFDQNLNASSVSIFPNPTNKELVIRYQLPGNNNVTFSVFDIVGKELLNKKTNKTEEIIDISELPNGIYFLKMWASTPMGQIENNVDVKKFVVQH